jgi:DUF917 family protein
VKEWGILDTVTHAIRLGRAVLAARSRHADPVEAVLEAGEGVRVFTGKIVDVDRVTTGGFLRGQARVAGLDQDVGATLELDFQNSA